SRPVRLLAATPAQHRQAAEREADARRDRRWEGQAGLPRHVRRTPATEHAPVGWERQAAAALRQRVAAAAGVGGPRRAPAAAPGTAPGRVWSRPAACALPAAEPVPAVGSMWGGRDGPRW